MENHRAELILYRITTEESTRTLAMLLSKSQELANRNLTKRLNQIDTLLVALYCTPSVLIQIPTYHR
jgi:hypothetical protein